MYECRQKWISDKGLVPIRRQAIIWANDAKFTDEYMRYAAQRVKFNLGA